MKRQPLLVESLPQVFRMIKQMNLSPEWDSDYRTAARQAPVRILEQRSTVVLILSPSSFRRASIGVVFPVPASPDATVILFRFLIPAITQNMAAPRVGVI